jgi:hypothetical protein
MIMFVEKNPESEFRRIGNIYASILIEKAISGYPPGVRGVIKTS